MRTCSLTTLPIMLFDERRLKPAFGYVFRPEWVDPHESIVSILWKFARMNRLSGNIVASHLSSTPIDPYEGVASLAESIDVERLHAVLLIWRCAAAFERSADRLGQSRSGKRLLSLLQNLFAPRISRLGAPMQVATVPRPWQVARSAVSGVWVRGFLLAQRKTVEFAVSLCPLHGCLRAQRYPLPGYATLVKAGHVCADSLELSIPPARTNYYRTQS